MHCQRGMDLSGFQIIIPSTGVQSCQKNYLKKMVWTEFSYMYVYLWKFFRFFEKSKFIGKKIFSIFSSYLHQKKLQIFWKNWWVQNSQIFSLKKFVRIQVFLYRNKPGSNNYHFCRQKIRAEIHQSLLTQFTLAVQFFDAKVPVKN